jgi:hypothetical protein
MYFGVLQSWSQKGATIQPPNDNVPGNGSLISESSIALATACFGDGVDVKNGHEETDVLYIAFQGSNAVPGASGADWGADNYDDFAASIESLGDALIQKFLSE